MRQLAAPRQATYPYLFVSMYLVWQAQTSVGRAFQRHHFGKFFPQFLTRAIGLSSYRGHNSNLQSQNSPNYTTGQIVLEPLPHHAPPIALPDKICRVVFHSNDNDPKNFDQQMPASGRTHECAAFAQRFMPEATDARVGCKLGSDPVNVGERLGSRGRPENEGGAVQKGNCAKRLSENGDASLRSRLLQSGRAVRGVQSLSLPGAAMLPLDAHDARPHAIG